MNKERREMHCEGLREQYGLKVSSTLFFRVMRTYSNQADGLNELYSCPPRHIEKSSSEKRDRFFSLLDTRKKELDLRVKNTVKKYFDNWEKLLCDLKFSRDPRTEYLILEPKEGKLDYRIYSWSSDHGYLAPNI